MLRLQPQIACPASDSPSSSPSCSRQSPQFRRCCARARFSPPRLISFSPSLSDLFLRRLRPRRPIRLLPCKASLQSPDGGYDDGDDDDDSAQFLEASLLVPETLRHYNLWKQGFVEETKWHAPSQKYPRSFQGNVMDKNITSMGHGFLRRFQSPTIFLKIACDGNLLLPIIVGEIAMDKLVEALKHDKHEDFPDQYQFAKNIVGTLGYEVKMVRITERVINTYHARIFLGKPAERSKTSVDARPSDALNVAIRLKAPIYISREVVLKDAIKLVYGRWRGIGMKTVYDVTLDSAAEGPDPLVEELGLVQRINLAVLEERYEDAAIWRDKLTKLHENKQEH